MIDIESVIVKPNKRRQKYSIEINGDAHVVLRTPLHPSQTLIRQLLTDHQPWIQKHQKKPKFLIGGATNYFLLLT